MQARVPGFSEFGGGLLGANSPSGLTINRSVRALTPGTVPALLGGLMILPWSGEFCAGAKLLSDTTMIANVAINNHVLLFIYFSLFTDSIVRAVADAGASRLKVRECQTASEKGRLQSNPCRFLPL